MDFDHSRHIFRSPKFKSVVNDAITFFIKTHVHKLPLPGRFIGAGVYALYYTGNDELYAKLAALNREAYTQPICVGKAVPPGWRTARTTGDETSDLCRRLREHARSIQQVANLVLDDFRCRFMILNGVEGDLVVPIEAEVIRRYRPLWNTLVDGFGNHDPGAGRYNQARSEWDTVHPGRAWAEKLTGISPRLEDTLAKIRQALASSPLS